MVYFRPCSPVPRGHSVLLFLSQKYCKALVYSKCVAQCLVHRRCQERLILTIQVGFNGSLQGLFSDFLQDNVISSCHFPQSIQPLNSAQDGESFLRQHKPDTKFMHRHTFRDVFTSLQERRQEMQNICAPLPDTPREIACPAQHLPEPNG